MPRITRVYTRTGDDGTTGLGGGQRVPKDSPRIEAYGTVDELSSSIGVAVALGLQPRLAETLARIQNELFNLGSDLCILEEDKVKMPVPVVEERNVEALERLMDELSEELSPLQNFILPGGSPGAAQLHVARTVCRRAERLVIALSRLEPVGLFVVKYLNRLSDALFVMARYENLKRGVTDVLWDSHA
ncbi:MAG TPA: cob(I)yrinic acid a,c-diamide adenosyltransferase [Thermoanaerobaculia bacterium]|jgi:cob(I)alamin adenosyltransferase|nr:cob(I)yrinic acid a,c-diamide adenosyltransferase [Thermoanaerobaculia bacterium]